MESDEDGVVVVIIGDDDENADDQTTFPAVTVKQEVFDEDEKSLNVEELLQTAEEHGEHIELSDLGLLTNIKPEPCEDSDEDFILHEHLESDDDEFERTPVYKSKHRVKLLSPSEQHSFVAKLRKGHPEFDTEDLIRHLTDIMKTTKPPPPPTGFYRLHESNYNCVICDALTNSLPAATRHYQEKHGPRYLICFACGVDFRSITNLYKHEKRCSAPDSVLVLQARARMVGRKGRHRPFLLLNEHFTRHKSGKKVYKNKVFNCSLCTAQFRTRSSLTAHEHLHRGERPYGCDHCVAAYTSKSALYRHRLTHKDAQYICDHCGKVFKAKSAIVYHMDTHLPQRKHACPYKDCGRRFAQKYALTIHIQDKHQNLPPPCACQLCPKRFTRMSILKVHMKKEHGMILMTRNMFFKSLPTLSDTQVQQAKVIFNDEKIVYHTEKIKNEAIDNDVKSVTPSVIPEKSDEEIVKFVEDLLIKKGEKLTQNGNIIVIENWEVKDDMTGEVKEEYEKIIEQVNESMPDL